MLCAKGLTSTYKNDNELKIKAEQPNTGKCKEQPEW